jgi:hypothetical protein
VKLRCSKCWAEVDSACECGASYIPAGKLAQKLTVEFPNMSSRAIAEKCGINERTVRRVRETLPENPKTVAAFAATVSNNPKRTGKDGKSYKAHKTKAEKWAEQQRASGAPYPEFTIEKAKEIGRMPDNTREKY